MVEESSESSVLGHNCGIYVGKTLHNTYKGMEALQNRGREVAGIGAVRRDGKIDIIKWVGKVKAFSLDNLQKIFPKQDYSMFMGHVRYATRGRKEFLLDDGHPHFQGGEVKHCGDHMIILNASRCIVHNGQVNDVHLQGIDRTNLNSPIDTAALLEAFRQKGEHGLIHDIPGTFCAVIADERYRDVIAIRDRTGIMPLVLGEKEGVHEIASENFAFSKTGAKVLHDLSPGSITYIHPQGDSKTIQAVAPSRNTCFFQACYIGNLESIIDDMYVQGIREELGRGLTKEQPYQADFVTYVPESAKVSAETYARVMGLDFVEIFYKQKDERSFQGSTKEQRTKSISDNLHFNPREEHRIKGKRIVVIDDSIVRGNNGPHAIKMLYEAGAAEVIFLSYTPKIGIIGEDGIPRGCLDGVDTPPSDNDFVARGRTDAEINQLMGAKTQFLSYEGMLQAFEEKGIKRSRLCTFCIGGKHPYLSLAELRSMTK